MKLKKVIRGKALQEKMLYAIELLCDTVKSTLGPQGSNVLIDHSAFTPFITNDGVTIAENIECEDAAINTILELAKEASINTNSLVGDGTTTTLVLLQQLINYGFDEVNKGKNPITLKKELEKDLNFIISKLKEFSKNPSDDDLESIAITSSNSVEIGKIVGEAYIKVRNKNAIKIKENINEETKVLYQKGYTIDTLLASSYFLIDAKMEITNPLVILVNHQISNLEEIAIYLNYSLKKDKSLIILADDYNDDVINDVLSINSELEKKIILLKIPEYGNNKQAQLKDLELISSSKIITELTDMNVDYLGQVEGVTVTEEETNFYFLPSPSINKKVEELFKLETEDPFIQKRIAMFNNGIINILVGAATTTERREKKMRFDDALCAISAASKGIVVGSGLTFCRVAEHITHLGKSQIFQKVLQEPFKQIMYNSGLNSSEIISKIKKENYSIVYNAKANKFESVNETTVLDPTDVVISSLKNATSIATMLLTTTSLIINEYNNNSHKINDFTDL